jgi:plastocyanin
VRLPSAALTGSWTDGPHVHQSVGVVIRPEHPCLCRGEPKAIGQVLNLALVWPVFECVDVKRANSMRETTRANGCRVSVMAVFALALAGCGGSSDGRSTSPSAAQTGAPAVGKVVNVIEKEFSITLPKAAMVPGTYTFQVNNQGAISHNLTVSGPGVATKGSSTISPGQSADLTVTLQKGSYEFWCSVDSHNDQGMDLTVKVG